jgi:hypothetical protein
LQAALLPFYDLAPPPRVYQNLHNNTDVLHATVKTIIKSQLHPH